MCMSALKIFLSKRRVLNLIIVLCLIAPALVSFWRGTWTILDLFVLPDCKLLGAWTTFAASFGIVYATVLVGDYLKAFLNERQAKKVLYLALFYPLAFVIVNTWRGLWMLLDHYTTTSLTSGCVSHAIGFLMVSLTQTTSSITAAPSYCTREKHGSQLETILHRKIWLNCSEKDIVSRILNSFFTVFVTGVGVISYWRGTWVVMDALTMSHESDKFQSSIISTSTGYALFAACYFVSEYVSNMKNLKPPFSLKCRALEQLYVYVLGFGTVNCWRGIWYMEDVYLLPDHAAAGAFIGHFVGLFTLYVLQTSLILVCSPAGCRVHGSERLEGFNLGSFLEKSKVDEKEMQNCTADATRASNVALSQLDWLHLFAAIAAPQTTVLGD